MRRMILAAVGAGAVLISTTIAPVEALPPDPGMIHRDVRVTVAEPVHSIAYVPTFRLGNIFRWRMPAFPNNPFSSPFARPAPGLAPHPLEIPGPLNPPFHGNAGGGVPSGGLQGNPTTRY
jgi:hypothetical protein